MELFALIKKNDNVEIVKSSDIEAEADRKVRCFINGFLDELACLHGEDYNVSLDDLDILYEDEMFGSFAAEYVLKGIIRSKKRYELKRILADLFSDYDLDFDLVNSVYKSGKFYNSFYLDARGNILYDSDVFEIFSERFGFFLAEDLMSRLDELISSSNYCLNYSVCELKEFVDSLEKLVKVDRDNFEFLLYLFGEIDNPKLPAASRHVCYNCANLSPLMCKKAEYYKRPIGAYSFINSGYQIFITTNYRDLIMTSFIVDDCQNLVVSDDDFIDKDLFSKSKRLYK